MKKTLFLILSGAIVIFSIICICSGPVITGVIPTVSDWKTINCQKLTDELKNYEDNHAAETTIKSQRKVRNKCNRDKAMYGLEYASLIFDVICGFVCTILGLLHFFDVGKPFEKVTGIIGLATGIIGFVLTFVYVIYSGYIFTNDIYTDSNGTGQIYKRNGDWAFAKKEDDGKFKCLYYKEGDVYSIYAKYSDVGKKQYNYNKKKKEEYANHNSDFYKCQGLISSCNEKYYTLTGLSDCKYLYTDYNDDTIEKKYLYDKWVTTIIFSCFIFACDIGLAIFGFLLFKSNGSGI